MTETGSTLTIKPQSETLRVEAPEGDEGPSDGAGRDWFAGATPSARSPWKGTTKVGMN